MDTYIPTDSILTPQMLRDRATVIRAQAEAVAMDAQWTDSSHARMAIEERARDLRNRAAAMEAEAATLEADLAAATKEIRHG